MLIPNNSYFNECCNYLHINQCFSCWFRFNLAAWSPGLSGAEGWGDRGACTRRQCRQHRCLFFSLKLAKQCSPPSALTQIQRLFFWEREYHTQLEANVSIKRHKRSWNLKTGPVSSSSIGVTGQTWHSPLLLTASKQIRLLIPRHSGWEYRRHAEPSVWGALWVSCLPHKWRGKAPLTRLSFNVAVKRFLGWAPPQTHTLRLTAFYRGTQRVNATHLSIFLETKALWGNIVIGRIYKTHCHPILNLGLHPEPERKVVF